MFWDQKKMAKDYFWVCMCTRQQFKTVLWKFWTLSQSAAFMVSDWQSGQECFQLQLAISECLSDCVFFSVQNIVQAVGWAFVCFIHSSWLSVKKKLMSPGCVYIIELGWNCPSVQKDRYFRHQLFMKISSHLRERVCYWQDWREFSSVKVIALLETREFSLERKIYGKLTSGD